MELNKLRDLSVNLKSKRSKYNINGSQGISVIYPK